MGELMDSLALTVLDPLELQATGVGLEVLEAMGLVLQLPRVTVAFHHTVFPLSRHTAKLTDV